MPKTSEKVIVKTYLSGPKFHTGYGTAPCSLKLPSEVLVASGLAPNDRVELIAEAGVIRIRKIGDPLPGLPSIKSKNVILDNLMKLTREHQARTDPLSDEGE